MESSAKVLKNTVNGLFATATLIYKEEIKATDVSIPTDVKKEEHIKAPPLKEVETEFEKNYCVRGMYCFQCRNEKRLREHVFSQKLVDKVDFDCEFRGLPMGVAVEFCPKETEEHINRNARMQENRKKVPDSIRAIRKFLKGQEVLKELDIIEETLFPNGLPAKCKYQTVTDVTVKAKGCGCSANVIECSHTEVDSMTEQKNTKDCSAVKCKYFEEDD